MGVCRERNWKFDWVLDVDIEKFFDTINHELMMKAVRKHCQENWVALYIERWLKAPIRHEDGRLESNERGTPQGGVISPLLANLYLHYAFDSWLRRKYSRVQFERYADDIIIHCQREAEALTLKEALSNRLSECGLRLNLEKTMIVYCKAGIREGMQVVQADTFLGYALQHRKAMGRQKRAFTSFLPAASK